MMALCLSIPALMLAQSKFQVKGSVKGEDGQALNGVSVREVGTSKGTTTDASGNFILNVTNDQASVEFSYVGFVHQRVKLNGRAELGIVLRNDLSNGSLKDVVVVGVQTQSKRTTTAAISSVSGKSIENLPSPSFDNLLQGRVPGMDVQVTSGEPGVSPSITVRGEYPGESGGRQPRPGACVERAPVCHRRGSGQSGRHFLQPGRRRHLHGYRLPGGDQRKRH